MIPARHLEIDIGDNRSHEHCFLIECQYVFNFNGYIIDQPISIVESFDNFRWFTIFKRVPLCSKSVSKRGKKSLMKDGIMLMFRCYHKIFVFTTFCRRSGGPVLGGQPSDLAAMIAAKAASRKPMTTSPTRKDFPSGSGGPMEQDARLIRSSTMGRDGSISDAR